MLASATPSLDAAHLTLFWASGETTCLSAKTLRKEAQDARSRLERHRTGDVQVADEITITGVLDMGYGINIHFSDGHDKAIYPAPYLRELCTRFDK